MRGIEFKLVWNDGRLFGETKVMLIHSNIIFPLSILSRGIITSI